MATSSIFHNFTINDKHNAERFVDALDAASKQPSRVPTVVEKKPLRDPVAIRSLMEKRKKIRHG
jgi:hypothetical protein